MALVKTSTVKRLIKARALRQGLIGGSPIWRAIWIAQFGYKQFSKLSKGGDPPISFDEPLKEGEVWALVHEPEKTKKGRGEGRKLLIGPKRKRSRANIMTGLALGVAGEKILAAPSAERINQILGEDVFDPPPLSKKEQRAAKKAAQQDAKLAKQQAKATTARAKSAARELRAAEKAKAAEQRSASKLAAAAAAAAAKQARRDERDAKRAAQSATRAPKRRTRDEATTEVDPTT